MGTRGVKSQSRAKTRARDSFPFNHEVLRSHERGQIILSSLWSTVEKKSQWWPREHWLWVGWGPREAHGGFQSGCVQEEGEGRAGAAGGQCHLVSLQGLAEQITDGIGFPSSSSIPHLSCQMLSSEGISPTMLSVLMLPWLQLHPHQQCGLTSSLESTEWRPVNYGPWTQSNLPPVFINKVALAHSHTRSFMYCLCLLLCYNGRVG